MNRIFRLINSMTLAPTSYVTLAKTVLTLGQWSEKVGREVGI